MAHKRTNIIYYLLIATILNLSIALIPYILIAEGDGVIAILIDFWKQLSADYINNPTLLYYVFIMPMLCVALTITPLILATISKVKNKIVLITLFTNSILMFGLQLHYILYKLDIHLSILSLLLMLFSYKSLLKKT